ncbi:hypothetical protein CEXT_756561 [Caerostris extrusa]|uniref:Uncharacterized protein n=1 Tax=Caerostris extrusa TaxID=172846 RepID=A0AAV4UGL7_CAEEX|nr:hypothetical protein CEXT_756561 [Caerostris extrusa]
MEENRLVCRTSGVRTWRITRSILRSIGGVSTPRMFMCRESLIFTMNFRNYLFTAPLPHPPGKSRKTVSIPMAAVKQTHLAVVIRVKQATIVA